MLVDGRMLRVFIMSALLLFSISGRAATLPLFFDGVDNGLLIGPFVGTGEFSYDGPMLPDGDYFYEDLLSPAFHADFGGDTFDESHIVTPLDEIIVVITGGGTQVLFGNIFTSGNTDAGGALDFENFANDTEFQLSFEPYPGGPGPNSLLYFTSNNFGDYGSVEDAPPIPIPAALPLFISALAGLGYLGRRRKRDVA